MHSVQRWRLPVIWRHSLDICLTVLESVGVKSERSAPWPNNCTSRSQDLLFLSVLFFLLILGGTVVRQVSVCSLANNN